MMIVDSKSKTEKIQAGSLKTRFSARDSVRGSGRDLAWRQAGKMVRKIRGLCDVRVVRLPSGAPSTYRLRATKTQGTVCTFEAAARAMGVMVGPGIQTEMECFFDTFVTRLLRTRGKMAQTSPSPHDTLRHDPTPTNC